MELWFLKKTSNVDTQGNHHAPGDTEYWEQGLNHYNLIRTTYLFADYAKLGSGVVNGDIFYSAHGENTVSLYSNNYGYTMQGDWQPVGGRKGSNGPAMFTFPVQNGCVYTLLIDCKCESGTLHLRAYYETVSNGIYSYIQGQGRLGLSNFTRQTLSFAFKAEYTGNATLYAYTGSTNVIAYVYSVYTEVSASYRQMSPTFVNTDEQVIISGYDVPISWAQTYHPVIQTKVFLVEGMQYRVLLSAKVDTEGEQVGFKFVKETDGTVVNNSGGSSSYSLGTFYSLNYPEVGETLFTSSYTGYVRLAANVSESEVKATVGYASIIPVNPFVPKTVIDMFTGYAHFSGDRVRFNPDGSGHLAGRNINWDKEGNANVNGIISARLLYSRSKTIEKEETQFIVNPPTNGAYLYISKPDAQLGGITITLPQPEEYVGLELRFFSMQMVRGQGLTTIQCLSKKIAMDMWDGWKKYDSYVLPANTIINAVSIGDVWIVTNSPSSST